MTSVSSANSSWFQRNNLALKLSGVSLLVTALNAVKPLHIDDAYVYYLAKHVSGNPLRPFSFEVFWGQWPIQFTELVAPPVFPYWLAIGMKLWGAGGSGPVLWKLWALPFVAVFVCSAYALFSRFCSRLAMPLVLITALSPAFLPSWNMMLDMPALGMSLCALALFARSVDRRSLGLCVTSGLVAGLAMQTKWTPLTVPVVMFVYSIAARQWRRGLCSVVLAGVVFGAWELAMWRVYGRTMFLWSVANQFASSWPKWRLAQALILTLGAVGGAQALIACVALRWPRWALTSLGILVLGGFCAVAVWPISEVVFGAMGLIAIGSVTGAVIMDAVPRGETPEHDRPGLLLVAWLLVEVAAYFVISPFGAMRRLLSVVFVMTLIVGRAASRSAMAGAGPRAVRLISVASVVIGLGFFALDTREAWVVKDGAEQTAAMIREDAGHARIWYTGHWGFAYYADRTGMKPLVPDHSLIRKGDWVVIPYQIERQKIAVSDPPLEAAGLLAFDDRIKLKTMRCYYGGVVPVRHRPEPRLVVWMFRARSDFVPATAWDAQGVASWVRLFGHLKWADRAAPVVCRYMTDPDPAVRAMMAATAGDLSPRVADQVGASLRNLLDDNNEAVRSAARSSLRKVTGSAR